MTHRLQAFGLFVTLAGAGSFAFQLIHEIQSRRQSGPFLVLTSPFLPRLYLFLIIAFLVAAVGLLKRSRASMFISIFGLIGVKLGYLGWYLYTKHILDSLSADTVYGPKDLPPVLFKLGDARWWHLLILVGAAILLAWELKRFFTFRAAQDAKKEISR